MADTYVYTVYCKPDDPRGHYSEEIDIESNRRLSVTEAKFWANDIIQEEYDPRLRPVKVVERGRVVHVSRTNISPRHCQCAKCAEKGRRTCAEFTMAQIERKCAETELPLSRRLALRVTRLWFCRKPSVPSFLLWSR